MQNTVLDERALKALNKKAAYGEDINIEEYEEPEGSPSIDSRDKARLPDIGIQESGRSGTYMQFDASVLREESAQKGIEVMSVNRALEKYDWLRDYWWKAVQVDQDKYTAYSHLHPAKGYFIRALPGVRSQFPVQSCLYMKSSDTLQNVHNIIIAEEGSELDIITGCAVGERNNRGLHIGISEFYIKKNAKVSFTMIHSWGERVAVRPRSGAIVEENGTFLSNYVNMRPTQSMQMYPTAYAKENATVRYSTIVVAKDGSNIDVGSRTHLEGRGARTEMVSRGISTGGNAFLRGDITGKAAGVKGHLECRGLIMGEKGMIYSVPELTALLNDVDLSHEAAIGKIAEEEIFYLMSRGLSEEEATSVIVRGFLNVDIKGLPPALDAEIKRIIDSSVGSL
ncbi:MAG: SufD family Fe-S cluster assembly protein [Candidatus Thermoplasmatota archaeon]|nr:SufD family Fe-S cluster assembly protein [Candidatus Thermoplasmatota archaeon]